MIPIPELADLFCTIILRAILAIALLCGLAAGIIAALILWVLNMRSTPETVDLAEITKYDEAA